MNFVFKSDNLSNVYIVEEKMELVYNVVSVAVQHHITHHAEFVTAVDLNCENM